MNKKIILIDMDGTIADFNKSILEKTKKENMGILSHEDLTHFRVEKNFSKKYWTEIRNMISKKDFYLNLEPIPDSVKYIKEIFNHKDIDAFFCTSPLLSEHCIPEKREWIRKYYGEDFIKKIIFSKDKTIVCGNILIDDKPTIDGVNENSTWEHVFFDQPYNQDGKNRRIIKWEDWKKIILD